MVVDPELARARLVDPDSSLSVVDARAVVLQRGSYETLLGFDLAVWRSGHHGSEEDLRQWILAELNPSRTDSSRLLLRMPTAIQYSQSRRIRASTSGWFLRSVSTLVSPSTLITCASPRLSE